jgi:hypothetical protein
MLTRFERSIEAGSRAGKISFIGQSNRGIFFVLFEVLNFIKMSRRHAKSQSTTILLTVLFFVIQVHVASEVDVQPMGSILFEDHGFPKKCFVQNDIALLATRLKFQNLLPNEGDGSLLNDEGVMAIARYFYGISEIIETMSLEETRQLVQKSFYDLLGR